MLYNNLCLETAKFASKDSNFSENAISGVLVTKDKMVATDSFRLMEISTLADAKVEDFPMVDGKSAMRGMSPVVVDAKALRGIKIVKNKNLPMLDNVAIKYIDDKKVEFMTTDLETARVTTVKRIDNDFPLYQNIFPAGEPQAKIIVNGDMLAEVLTTLAKVGKLHGVKIKIYGADKPIVLTAGNGHQTARAMMMPIKF